MNTKKILQFSLGPIGGAAIGLITVPIITQIFSQEDVGRLSMMQLTFSFTLLLFSLGLDQAYVREFHEVDSKEGLLKTAITPGLLLLTFVMVILLISPLSLSELLFGIHSILLTQLLLLGIYLSFFCRFLGLILRMQEQGLSYSLSQLLPKLLFLSIILFYFWAKIDVRFESLMLANILSLLAVFIVFGWATRKEWIKALSSNIDRSDQYKMLRYSIPLIGSGLAFWGLTTMDKLFLRELSGFNELGIYSVAFSFAGVALIFQSIFSTIWGPLVYRWVKEGVDPQKFHNVINYTTLALILIWSAAGTFSGLVNYILPREYSNVQYILIAAMAYPLLYTLSEATGAGINIKRQTIYAFLASILALIINAVGNLVLIPIYQAAGAAIASSIAFLMFFIIRTEISNRIWLPFPRTKIYLPIFILVALSIFINITSLQVYTRIAFLVIFLTTLIISLKVLRKLFLKQREHNVSF